jgi:hypothetical protein
VPGAAAVAAAAPARANGVAVARDAVCSAALQPTLL